MTDTPPLKRFGVRIALMVREAGVLHDYVLKDHALSYLLAGIFGVPDLRAHLVFKGGTALRKCFFPDFRYSEDLDFSTRDRYHWSRGELLELLTEACRKAEEMTALFGPYSFLPRAVEHAAEHPHDQLDFKVDVAFPTGANLVLKVEVTQEEPIVLEPVERSILHNFGGEMIEVTVPTYQLDEIVLEKLRAFLQTRANLERRGWTNRSRDLYDLYVIHHDHADMVQWTELLEPLHVKAATRSVAFSGIDDFTAPEVLAAYQELWLGQLENLVPGPLPEFADAEAELRQTLSEVFGLNVDGAVPRQAIARGRARRQIEDSGDRQRMDSWWPQANSMNREIVKIFRSVAARTNANGLTSEVVEVGEDASLLSDTFTATLHLGTEGHRYFGIRAICIAFVSGRETDGKRPPAGSSLYAFTISRYPDLNTRRPFPSEQFTLSIHPDGGLVLHENFDFDVGVPTTLTAVEARITRMATEAAPWEITAESAGE